MLERAEERKEDSIGTSPHENVGELQWACRDIAAMLRREQFEEVVDHLKNGISAKYLRIELFKEDGAPSESHRKRIYR